LCQAVYIHENCLFITGGINEKMNDITNEFYWYNPINDTA